MCPRKYQFRYVLGTAPDFRSIALVLGSAVGSAIGWWFEERLAGRTRVVAAALDVLVADVHAETLGMPVRWKDKERADLEQVGQGLVALYLDAHADLPVAQVEAPFRIDLADPLTGEVMPRALKGYFDLTLEDGTVIELKTSSRSWHGSELDRHLQLGAYVAAEHARSGGEPSNLRVHVLVKTKKPKLEEFTIARTEADNRWWLDAAFAIEGAILARHFPPSPGPLCIECEYGRACAKWDRLAIESHEHSDTTSRPDTAAMRLPVVQPGAG